MLTAEKRGRSPNIRQATEALSVWTRALPWLIAAFFSGLSLTDRNLQEVGPWDAARHMLNGALLHDIILRGGLHHPMAFARQFYTSYPATSLPFHPPLFPLFEAVLYSIFGVEPAVARVAIAITVAASAWLLYALVLELNGSVALAFLTTATFMSLRICRDVASDVMLEFPSLVLMLAALYCVRRFDRKFSVRAGILFGLLGGAAVWTKQTAVGLGAVPWLLAVLARRWRYFRQAPIWISSAIFGLLTVGILALPVMTLHFADAGGKSKHTLLVLIKLYVLLYFDLVEKRFFLAGLVAVAAGILWAAARVLRRKEGWFADSFYLAWIFPIIAVALVTPQRDERYILNAYPAMIALGYLALFRAAGRILPQRWVWYPAFAAALAICGYGFAARPDSLSGVRPAAQFLASEGPLRILYFGGNLQGDFVAQLRAANLRTPPIVIRADQLPLEMRTPAALDEFAHHYGVDHVVLERSVVWQQRSEHLWDALPTLKMAIEKEFPVFNRSSACGELVVYRFTDPAANPPSSVEVRSKLLGRTLAVGVDDNDFR